MNIELPVCTLYNALNGLPGFSAVSLTQGCVFFPVLLCHGWADGSLFQAAIQANFIYHFFQHAVYLTQLRLDFALSDAVASAAHEALATSLGGAFGIGPFVTSDACVAGLFFIVCRIHDSGQNL